MVQRNMVSTKKNMNDIKNIRRRWISLFDSNFKASGSKKKPYEFPNQYWFLEKDSHDQYHFHLISECIEPDLLARSLDRDSFKYRFNTIRKKYVDRKQLIITEQMILKYPEFYKDHPLVGEHMIPSVDTMIGLSPDSYVTT